MSDPITAREVRARPRFRRILPLGLAVVLIALVGRPEAQARGGSDCTYESCHFSCPDPGWCGNHAPSQCPVVQSEDINCLNNNPCTGDIDPFDNYIKCVFGEDVY